MLTGEASADRYWLGARALREVLEPRRAEYESTVYFTSITEGPADHAQQVLHLAGMVAALRSTILESLEGSPEEPSTRTKTLLSELNGLRRHIAGVRSSAAEIEQAVGKLLDDLYRASHNEGRQQPGAQA